MALVPCNFLIDIKLIPSPLAGEGEGGGEVAIISAVAATPTPNPSRKGRGVILISSIYSVSSTSRTLAARARIENGF